MGVVDSVDDTDQWIVILLFSTPWLRFNVYLEQ